MNNFLISENALNTILQSIGNKINYNDGKQIEILINKNIKPVIIENGIIRVEEDNNTVKK